MSPGIAVDIEIAFLTVPTPPAGPHPGRHLLNTTRKRLRLSISQAAHLLGIGALEVAGLELGKRVFADPDAWRKAVDRLREAAGE